ncbi:MAG: VirB6/TrbL-like conjugal transfer protein, CD1112 family [Enterocloster clostridioformis]
MISGGTAVDASAAIATLTESLEEMEDRGTVFAGNGKHFSSALPMSILSVIITVIMYGRMIEINLYTSVAPIPFATMTNKEWGNIGNNYLKGLFALAFQGFFMLVCVGIVSHYQCDDHIHEPAWGTFAVAASYGRNWHFTV